MQLQKRPHSPVYSAAMQHQSISDLGKGQGNDSLWLQPFRLWPGMMREMEEMEILWYFPYPFLPGPRVKMEGASQGAPSAAGVYLWGRNDILEPGIWQAGI